MARLTRSKTIDSDRAITMRLVVISKGAFVQSPSWMVTSWQLLTQEAAFDRDFLLPSPTDGFRGCRHKELKYVIGSAVQFRVLSFLNVDGKQLFSHKVPQHWTPRKGRNFLPSVAAALGYPEADKDLLGAWSAKASDRYSRLAMKRIPLAESETLESFRGFVSEISVRDESVAAAIFLLAVWQLAVVAREREPTQQPLEPHRQKLRGFGAFCAIFRTPYTRTSSAYFFGEPSMANSCWLSRAQGRVAGTPGV